MNYSESTAVVVAVPVVAIDVKPVVIDVGVEVSSELCNQLTKSKSPSIHYSILNLLNAD